MAYAFTLPTGSAVVEDSRLRPEQVKSDYDATDLENEATERIGRKATQVNGKIQRASSPYPWPFTTAVLQAAYPNYDSDQLAAEVDDQKAKATEATNLYAQASLYGSAGQLNSAYFRKATELKTEADAIMSELMESISYVTEQQTDNTIGVSAAVWTIDCSDVYDTDEYSP